MSNVSQPELTKQCKYMHATYNTAVVSEPPRSCSTSYWGNLFMTYKCTTALQLEKKQPED